jgi:hypothetical protein
MARQGAARLGKARQTGVETIAGIGPQKPQEAREGQKWGKNVSQDVLASELLRGDLWRLEIMHYPFDDSDEVVLGVKCGTCLYLTVPPAMHLDQNAWKCVGCGKPFADWVGLEEDLMWKRKTLEAYAKP